MSNTTKQPVIAQYLDHCNGFDQTFKNWSYPGVVYSPAIRWLMTEANLHWMVSDMLVIAGCKSDQFREIQEDWHTEARFINETKAYIDDETGEECISKGRMEYHGVDPMTGRDKIIFTQYYESHSFGEKQISFYIRDHVDGGRPCKIVLVRQED